MCNQILFKGNLLDVTENIYYRKEAIPILRCYYIESFFLVPDRSIVKSILIF